MIDFRGTRTDHLVTVTRRIEGTRHQLKNRRGDTAFDWGEGSRLRQAGHDLAYSILFEWSDGHTDLIVVGEFHHRAIIELADDWQLTYEQVEGVVLDIRMDHGMDCIRCGGAGHYNPGEASKQCSCPAGRQHKERMEWHESLES